MNKHFFLQFCLLLLCTIAKPMNESDDAQLFAGTVLPNFEDHARKALFADRIGYWVSQHAYDDNPVYHYGFGTSHVVKYSKEALQQRLLTTMDNLAAFYPDVNDQNQEQLCDVFWNCINLHDQRIAINIGGEAGRFGHNILLAVSKPTLFAQCALLYFIYIDQQNHRFIVAHEYYPVLRKKLPILKWPDYYKEPKQD